MVKVKLYFLSIWTILDPIYYLFTRLTYIHDVDDSRTVFRVRLTRYKGRSIVLSDGTEINKNDLLIKIHLHNVKLLKEMYEIDGETAKGRLIYSKVKDGLPRLASYINRHDRYHEIKGIIGITMLNKGCQRLGFETYSIKNRYYCFLKQIVFVPMYILTSNRLSKSTVFRKPKYLVMSKDTLMKQYHIE